MDVVTSIIHHFSEFVQVTGAHGRGHGQLVVHPSVKLGGVFLLLVLISQPGVFTPFHLLVLLLALIALTARIGALERLFFEPILVMFYFALVTSIAYLALNWGAFTTELAMFEPGMLFSDGVLNHVLALNLRVVTALWIGRLLLFTTSISDLLHGLRKLHVPGILINLLAVTFRYIYVLAGELQNVTVAKELRAPVVKGTVKRLKALGNVYAAALNRSLLRSTNVAIAMELRGSTSNFIARTPAFSRSKSILFVACMISIVALVFAFPDPAAILGLA